MATEFTHDYPLAKGHMATVWGKGVCPVCDGNADHVNNHMRGNLWLRVYHCTYCCNLVIYISPAKYDDYYEVPADERWYCIDAF